MSDPIWLPDVLRAAGLTCDIYPGAMDRGHGDFGAIWGVVCHHTGSFGETPRGIAQQTVAPGWWDSLSDNQKAGVIAGGTLLGVGAVAALWSIATAKGK
jgi:hypothetical protein